MKKGLYGILAASLSRAGWRLPEVEVFIAKLKVEMSDLTWMIQDKA